MFGNDACPTHGDCRECGLPMCEECGTNMLADCDTAHCEECCQMAGCGGAA